MLFSFTGPGVPSLAVLLSSRPFGACFIKPSAPGCFNFASGEPSAHTWLTASVCLAPVDGCDRVSVSCSKHALQNASLALLQALGTDTNGCLRRAAPRQGPRDCTSHEPPAWRRFTRALVCNVSGHATLAGRVTSLHSLRLQSGPLRVSSAFNSGTLHVLPRATAPPSALRWLFTTHVALAVLQQDSPS